MFGPTTQEVSFSSALTTVRVESPIEDESVLHGTLASWPSSLWVLESRKAVGRFRASGEI